MFYYFFYYSLRECRHFLYFKVLCFTTFLLFYALKYFGLLCASVWYMSKLVLKRQRWTVEHGFFLFLEFSLSKMSNYSRLSNLHSTTIFIHLIGNLA
jgi:hypothetical protein